MAAARSAVYLRTTSLWGEGRYRFLRRATSTSLGCLLEKEAVRKRGVAAHGAVELLLWGVFFYSWGGQIKKGAEHRRTEGKHRRNYFFSGVNGYYFCVGVVLVDGG